MKTVPCFLARTRRNTENLAWIKLSGPNTVCLKKRTKFEMMQLKIIRIDFDDIWQKYSKYSRIEFVCFSFHVVSLFLSTFRVSNHTHRKSILIILSYIVSKLVRFSDTVYSVYTGTGTYRQALDDSRQLVVHISVSGTPCRKIRHQRRRWRFSANVWKPGFLHNFTWSHYLTWHLSLLYSTLSWLGGVVVSVSDSWSEGHGFDSWPPHYQSPRSTQPSIPPG